MNLLRTITLPLGALFIFITGGTVVAAQGVVVDAVVSSPRANTNSPYSATEESEHTQTLADGTHIVTKNHVQLYRDSAGRTRREMFLPEWAAGEANVLIGITIVDPIAGVVYNLQPQNHTAHMMSFGSPTQPPPSNATSAPIPLPKRPPSELAPKIAFEDLGIQTIDGFEARGKRITRTIPTGAEGNDAPIVMTSETWFSDELSMQVLSKNSDPRSGESITRITNLDRSEPDPALFKVPADYTVVDNSKN